MGMRICVECGCRKRRKGWYEHIAESIEELRDELVHMQSANATPREFGLKVRGHPDALMVTARNKMGSSEPHKVMIGLANRFVETAILHRDRETIDANLRAVGRWRSVCGPRASDRSRASA